MGKVVKFTGSKLLGEELRRLRGGRSLDDMVEMGKSKLLQYGFKSVAKASLSEIENGITLPNIESVFALSILYQVPTSRFLHILLEENLVEEHAAPESDDDLREAYTKAVHEQRPTEALALATRALRRAAPGWETLRWRLNRATAIERLGMRWDAVAELQEAIDNPALPTATRYVVHFDLSRMHASGGQFSLAEMHLEKALAMAPTDVPATMRASLLQAQVRLLVLRKLWGQVIGDDALAVAEERLSEALRLSENAPAADRLALLHLRAELAYFRQSIRSARSLFGTLLTEARALDLINAQVEALFGLASCERRERPERARDLLAQAAELAVASNHIDRAFLAYFDLHDMAQSPEQRRHYWRKCQRLYPLVRSTHPSVRAFESMRESKEAR